MQLRASDALNIDAHVQLKESEIVNINSGLGREYFFGLIRMTQFKFLRFVTILEIIAAFITVIHFTVFYLAENDVIK